MDSASLAQFINEFFLVDIRHGSLLILQAAGLIGILATLLVLRGTSILSERLGIIMGCTNLIMAFLLEDWLQQPIKPYLRNDLLFIAGFFGGWKHATYALSLTWLGRALFGGQENLLLAGIDIVLITYGAALLKGFFRNISLEIITHSTLAKVMCLRVLVVTFPLLALFITGVLPEQIAVNIAKLRLFSNFSTSIIVIYAVIFLLRRELAREQLIYLDNVSSLPNRRALQQEITQTYTQSREAHTSPNQVLILTEISNLHELIQEHGHDWADTLLRQTGEYLDSLCKAPGLSRYQAKVFCFSDRAFAIILHNVTLQEVRETELADNLLGRLFVFNQKMQQSLRILPALGVIDIEFKPSFSSSWFLRALNAIITFHPYAFVHYFDADITRRVQSDNYLRSQMDQWIETDSVPLWLQPKIDLTSRRCVGAEVLLRAEDQASPGRHIPPPYVLSISAKHHLQQELEWAIVRTTVKQLRQLPEAFNTLVFSVNISPLLLSKLHFALQLQRLLQDNGIHGKQLSLEITETDELTVTENVQTNIATLLQCGISLSLDDFGSGYASLSLFSKLPFHELKLDYSMISGLDLPRVHAAITLSVDTAKKYAARVVAEGVETETQYQQLMKMGIQFGQGFLFSRAIPLDKFIGYVQQHADNESPDTKMNPAAWSPTLST